MYPDVPGKVVRGKFDTSSAEDTTLGAAEAGIQYRIAHLSLTSEGDQNIDIKRDSTSMGEYDLKNGTGINLNFLANPLLSPFVTRPGEALVITTDAAVKVSGAYTVIRESVNPGGGF